MKTEDIKIVWKKFVPIYEKIPCLHSGGCGISAVEIYKIFVEIGVKAELRMLTRKRYELSIAISNRDMKNISEFTHIVVYIKGLYIDCARISKNISDFGYERDVEAIGIDVELVEELNNYGENWSDSFNRRKYIPKVKKEFKLIKQDLAVNGVIEKKKESFVKKMLKSLTRA